MTTARYQTGTFTGVLSTGLNSLANNALALSSAQDNVAGQTFDGFTQADVELVCQFGVAPAASSSITLWFIQSADGTNYEDGSSGVTPARAPDVIIPVRAVTTAQRIVKRVWLPAGLFKVLAMNDATGQALAASGNTIGIRPVTRQDA